jgi:hypothetical protein
MNAQDGIPQGACVTIETFEKLIRMDEERRKALLAEIAALRLRERVIGASEDASWVTARFIEPRLAELRAVDARIALIREKLTHLLASLAQAKRATPPAPKPAPAPCHVWMESHDPSMLVLAA